MRHYLGPKLTMATNTNCFQIYSWIQEHKSTDFKSASRTKLSYQTVYINNKSDMSSSKPFPLKIPD